MTDVTIPDMAKMPPDLYRHPGEKAALASLEKVPGLARILSAMAEYSGGQPGRHACLAASSRVGPGVYPELWELWNRTLGVFGLSGVELYVSFHAPEPWLVRGANELIWVELSADTLWRFQADEMAALLARLAGSIRLGDAANLAAAAYMRNLPGQYGLAGAPAVLLAWALEAWRRHAEISADRAAALACGSPEPVVSFLNRLAGAGADAWGGVSDPESLRLQGVEARAWLDDWQAGRRQRLAMAMDRNGHCSLVRRLDLLEWSASDAWTRLIRGEWAFEGEPEAGPGIVGSSALWGAFAPPPLGDADGEADWQAALGDMRDAFEKGVGTFWKAGEAFWKSLSDKDK